MINKTNNPSSRLAGTAAIEVEFPLSDFKWHWPSVPDIPKDNISNFPYIIETSPNTSTPPSPQQVHEFGWPNDYCITVSRADPIAVETVRPRMSLLSCWYRAKFDSSNNLWPQVHTMICNYTAFMN